MKTPVRLKELLGPNAEKELAELNPTGDHNPELSERSLSTEVM